MEPFGLVDVRRVVGELSGDRAVGALASRQEGLVTTAQLGFMGIGRGAIRHRVSAGRLFPERRGIYLVGHKARTELTGMAGAVLATGPAALLAGSAALWVWEILERQPAVIDVAVRRGTRRSRDGIRVHRAHGLHPGEARTRRGLPVVSPAAALLDLADLGDVVAVERALNEGREKKLVTQADLQRVVEGFPGRTGIPILRGFLEEQVDEDFSRKEAERIMWRLILDSGLPKPRRNVWVHGYELDFYWPDLSLNVETDGVRWHSSRRKVNRDRDRDAGLAPHGVQVLRFTWDQLKNKPLQVLARLAGTVALADHRRRTTRSQRPPSQRQGSVAKGVASAPERNEARRGDRASLRCGCVRSAQRCLSLNFFASGDGSVLPSLWVARTNSVWRPRLRQAAPVSSSLQGANLPRSRRHWIVRGILGRGQREPRLPLPGLLALADDAGIGRRRVEQRAAARRPGSRGMSRRPRRRRCRGGCRRGRRRRLRSRGCPRRGGCAPWAGAAGFPLSINPESACRW